MKGNTDEQRCSVDFCGRVRPGSHVVADLAGLSARLSARELGPGAHGGGAGCEPAGRVPRRPGWVACIGRGFGGPARRVPAVASILLALGFALGAPVSVSGYTYVWDLSPTETASVEVSWVATLPEDPGYPSVSWTIEAQDGVLGWLEIQSAGGSVYGNTWSGWDVTSIRGMTYDYEYAGPAVTAEQMQAAEGGHQVQVTLAGTNTSDSAQTWMVFATGYEGSWACYAKRLEPGETENWSFWTDQVEGVSYYAAPVDLPESTAGRLIGETFSDGTVSSHWEGVQPVSGYSGGAVAGTAGVAPPGTVLAGGVAGSGASVVAVAPTVPTETGDIALATALGQTIVATGKKLEDAVWRSGNDTQAGLKRVEDAVFAVRDAVNELDVGGTSGAVTDSVTHSKLDSVIANTSREGAEADALEALRDQLGGASTRAAAVATGQAAGAEGFAAGEDAVDRFGAVPVLSGAGYALPTEPSGGTVVHLALGARSRDVQLNPFAEGGPFNDLLRKVAALIRRLIAWGLVAWFFIWVLQEVRQMIAWVYGTPGFPNALGESINSIKIFGWGGGVGYGVRGAVLALVLPVLLTMPLAILAGIEAGLPWEGLVGLWHDGPGPVVGESSIIDNAFYLIDQWLPWMLLIAQPVWYGVVEYVLLPSQLMWSTFTKFLPL